MKILWAHLIPRKPGSVKRITEPLSHMPAGVEIKLQQIGISRSYRKIPWPLLDHCWQRRDPDLMRSYDAILEAASDCDVMIVDTSWNIHPQLLEMLPTYNIMICADDPESSEKLSRPMAGAYDGAIFYNIASQMQYASWGCKHFKHLPLVAGPEPNQEQRKTLLQSPRDNDIVYCGAVTRWRQGRMSKLMAPFPQARCHGNGWPAGLISEEDLLQLYARSRIGWNIHNSTGPINSRLTMLASWGVMPLCDNKTGLGMLFDLGREAVGFDTIDQAIELTQYYLDHEDERRSIAHNAYKRYWRDYSEQMFYPRLVDTIRQWMAADSFHATHTSPCLSTRRGGAAAVLMRRFDRLSFRYSMKLKKRWQRWRHRLSIYDYDERFYCDACPEYRMEKRAQNAKAFSNVARTASANDPHHQQAVCWSLSATIDSAERIVVTGDNTQELADLVCLDPARKVETSASQADLILDTQPAVTPDESQQRAMRHLTIAPRCVMVLRPEHAADCDRFYTALKSKAGEVLFLFMPDPYVPWLEPLDGGAPACPIVALCKR